jgi:protein-S-isoprenylcysteine O-methyltransferase Ste14
MIRIVVFALLSVPLAWVSRHALSDVRSHGFYRFWAWEAILGLAVLNAPLWFSRPFAWYQLISWCLLIACLAPLLYGVRSLRAAARADAERTDAALLGFEKTAELVTSGIYHYVRHPLYSSLFLLAWGVYFKAPSWPGTALALVASACLLATARREERENVLFFGPAYAGYMRQTKRFLPYLF